MVPMWLAFPSIGTRRSTAPGEMASTTTPSRPIAGTAWCTKSVAICGVKSVMAPR